MRQGKGPGITVNSGSSCKPVRGVKGQDGASHSGKRRGGSQGRGTDDDDGSQRYASRPKDLAAENAVSNERV
ncbi:MAG: hypothetical protein HKN14_03555 [Marinicaulis sp.]|nr:hypothetical protein [Marinicaulis sp.]NNL89580.1 hypothetical protein [Marinicaulis sp.]